MDFFFSHKSIVYSSLDFRTRPSPPNWNYTAWDLDSSNPDNNGYQNEDFIVWMRTAAMPTFRKLYRRLLTNSSGAFQDGLPQGNYTLQIDYSKFRFDQSDEIVIFFCRLSRIELRRTKTIYHQYHLMDGRKKSLSWLGIYRCWNHFINRFHCLFRAA